MTTCSGPSSDTVNVPHARTYGVELEGEIKPVRWLDLGGTFNYTHAVFSRDPVIFANAAPVVFDQVPDTPKTSGTLYAEVTVPVAANLDVTLRGALYAQAQSFSFSQSQNNPGSDIPGYGLADFRVGIESKRWAGRLMRTLKTPSTTSTTSEAFRSVSPWD